MWQSRLDKVLFYHKTQGQSKPQLLFDLIQLDYFVSYNQPLN